jgi:GPH family glycoside/pentoside/hexuronide:cation symporter
MPPPPLTNRVRWLYGFGSVAYGVKDNGFSYFLMFYYNQVLGLPGSLAGLAILIAMIFDAISDPVVGFWSDSTHSRWGRRHPFMYAAALPVAVAYYFLWNPPIEYLSQFGLFIYLTAGAVLVRQFITLYEIPSTSIVAELTENYDERTRLLSLRYMFGWIGGLLMALLMWGVLMVAFGVANQESFKLYGGVGAVAMFLAIVTSSAGLHGHIPYLRQPPVRTSHRPMQIVHDVRVTLSNRNFLALFLAGLFAAIGAGVSTNFNAYVNTHFWEFRPEQVRWIILSLFCSAALAATLAPIVTRRFDKKATAIGIYAISIVFGAAPVLLRLAGWFPQNHTPWLFPIMLVHQIIEVTLIIMFGIIQSSMLADVVEESEMSTGRREEGLFFAARTFAGKATSGIGALIAGIALDVIHFPKSAAPGDVPPDVIFKLGVIYGPSLMILYFLALWCITYYRIGRRDHDGRVQSLAARMAESAPAKRRA